MSLLKKDLRAPFFVFGACWLIRSVVRDPFRYALSTDADVLLLQSLHWIRLLAEAGVTAAAGCVLLALLRHGISLATSARPFVRISDASARFLNSSLAPLAAGALSAAALAWVWGLHPAPFVHDEAAYLLQARIYATGRWSAPPAPLPEFFEQMYVFVWPFTAAKYPPGFPLALVPGIWLGMPAIVPIALVGLSGGLLFALARRVTNACVASLSWLIWTTIPHKVWPLPPFLSQHLLTALWLASWWALERWRSLGRSQYLLLMAFFIGWGAITRPLTMLAAAIPIGFVVIGRVARLRSWKPAAAACGVGLAVLSLLPLWNIETTGSWKTSPLALHVRWYTPYDSIGFGWQPAHPIRALPPELDEVARILSRDRTHHTIRRLPDLIQARAREIFKNSFAGWRKTLLPPLLFGLLWVPIEGLVAVTSVVLNFVAYLVLAHPVQLSMYYVESYSVLAFLAAVGIWRLLSPREPDKRTTRLWSPRIDSGAAIMGLFLFAMMAGPGLDDLWRYRETQSSRTEAKLRFREVISSLPGRSSVFVRYPKGYPAFTTLVENDPDLSSEKIWVVHDLGPENARLRALAPNRVPYLFIASNETLVRLDRPLSPANRELLKESLHEKWTSGALPLRRR